MTVRGDLEQLVSRLEADTRGMDAEVLALLREHEQEVGALTRWLEHGEGEPAQRFDYLKWVRIGAVLQGREAMLGTAENLRRVIGALAEEEARDGPQS